MKPPGAGEGAGDPNRNVPALPPAAAAGAPNVKPVVAAELVAGAAEAGVDVPPPTLPAAGAPNVKLVEAALVAGAVEAGAGDPNVNPPAGLAGVEAGVADPNANVGAPEVFCGESSIISPAPCVVTGAAAAAAAGAGVADLGAPKLNPPAPNPPAAGADALPAPDAAPNEKPPAGLAPSPLAAPPNENVGVLVPDPGAELLADAGADSAPPAGFPNENDVAAGAGLAVSPALSPLPPKKFGTLLGGASSFFAAGAAAGAGEPKLNPLDAGAADAAGSGLDAVGAPNAKLGMLFLAAGSSSSAARFAPVDAEVEGVPKLNPPELVLVEPKNDGLLAGAADSAFSTTGCAGCAGCVGLAPNPPKGDGVSAGLGSDAGFAPKLNGAGLAASSLAAAAGALKENPPAAGAGLAAGASSALGSNFFMVLPKKLGTGPSFLPSVSDAEEGSAGLLKKSDAGGAADGFFCVLSSLPALATAPKLNLGGSAGVCLAEGGKENERAEVVGLGASLFSLDAESKPPSRPSSEPPAAAAGAGAGAGAGVVLGASLVPAPAAALAASPESRGLPPKEKPDGNMLVGSLILASSVASGRPSSSSSSSQALNLPEL